MGWHNKTECAGAITLRIIPGRFRGYWTQFASGIAFHAASVPEPSAVLLIMAGVIRSRFPARSPTWGLRLTNAESPVSLGLTSSVAMMSGIHDRHNH